MPPRGYSKQETAGLDVPRMARRGQERSGVECHDVCRQHVRVSTSLAGADRMLRLMAPELKDKWDLHLKPSTFMHAQLPPCVGKKQRCECLAPRGIAEKKDSAELRCFVRDELHVLGDLVAADAGPTSC